MVSPPRTCGICGAWQGARLRYKAGFAYCCWNCEQDFKHRFNRWMRKGEFRSIVTQLRG